MSRDAKGTDHLKGPPFPCKDCRVEVLAEPSSRWHPTVQTVLVGIAKKMRTDTGKYSLVPSSEGAHSKPLGNAKEGGMPSQPVTVRQAPELPIFQAPGLFQL